MFFIMTAFSFVWWWTICHSCCNVGVFIIHTKLCMFLCKLNTIWAPGNNSQNHKKCYTFIFSMHCTYKHKYVHIYLHMYCSNNNYPFVQVDRTSIKKYSLSVRNGGKNRDIAKDQSLFVIFSQNQGPYHALSAKINVLPHLLKKILQI